MAQESVRLGLYCMAHTANGVKILLGSVPTTHTLLSNSHHRARKSFVAADETAHSCRQRTRLAQRAPARPHVAFSVYRDEGALSEIDIVECLAEHDLLQLADLQTSLNERSSSTLAEVSSVYSANPSSVRHLAAYELASPLLKPLVTYRQQLIMKCSVHPLQCNQ